MKRICPRCNARSTKKHRNAKWCHPCAEALKRQPRGTLSASERQFAIRHAGDMKITEIAKRLGTSVANVKRSCRGVRFFAHNGKYKERPDLVRQVLDYYFEHGKAATEEAFPNVNVKCIVDRPEYYGVKRQYRQKRWTAGQHLEAVRMAGLVPLDAQAKHFARPGANAGAMKSFWIKRVGMAGGQIHGMADWNARWIVTDRCPRLRVKYLAPRDAEAPSVDGTRPIVLWIDAEKHLRSGTPEFIATGIRTMADFTRWVFGVKHPKRAILKMMRERT
jgi:hypothetical protein